MKTASEDIRMIESPFMHNAPISSMEFIPFRFGVLNLYRQTHHDSPAKYNGLVYKFDGTELHIADTVTRSAMAIQCCQKAHPLERLEIRSVTIRESITEPSPSLSSKKYPRSRAVKRAAS